MTFEALDSKTVGEKKKELQAAYREAVKEYNSLSGDAKANAKEPVRPSVKSKKSFADLDQAVKYAMELQKKFEETKEKK
ncbi:MAG: hypothetical protein GXP25_11650 [Planctomycetes bacterium]|nr:hypothetical protein [Planctomycetota bacterium]